MKVYKINNKGLSLVEILTALAISSIILLGVVAFMNGGSVTYRTATTQVALQDDVQETSNYLYDLLQRSMEVVYDSTLNVLYLFMPKKDTTIDSYEVYYVCYNNTNNQIYVGRRSVTDDNYATGLKIDGSDKNSFCIQSNLLATEIKSFNVREERNAKGEPDLVHVELGFRKNNSDRYATISVRPRNRGWTYTNPLCSTTFYELITGFPLPIATPTPSAAPATATPLPGVVSPS